VKAGSTAQSSWPSSRRDLGRRLQLSENRNGVFLANCDSRESWQNKTFDGGLSVGKITNNKELAQAVRREQEILNLSANNNFGLTESQTAELDGITQNLDDYLGSSSQSGHGSSSSGFGGSSSGGASDSIRVLPATSEQLDHDLGVLFQSRILSNIDHIPVATIAKDTFKNDRVASASMYAGEHASGGAWIQGVYLDRFIELLRPLSIVRMMGVDTVPLDDGTLLMPKETAGPTGQYLGEKESANVETVGSGDVKLIGKELVCMVAASEKLMRSPSANAANRIRNSVLRGAGQTEDLYFLRGIAGGAGPTGMRYLAALANILTANGTVNLQNITNDLGRLELALLNGNVAFFKPAWIMAPRTMVYLMDLRDSNGNLAWPSLSLERPTLRGKPVFATTQIPINLGSGDKSEIMLAEASHLIIGDSPRVGFDSSNVAAYLDGGVMKASFSERKVVTRLVMENDFNTLYDQAIAVLTNVNWGA
jgi:HK97 family phage major capsid protein